MNCVLSKRKQPEPLTTKTTEAMSEIFRFVQIRPAQIEASNQEAYQLLRDDLQTAFHADLSNLRVQSDSLEGMQLLARNFVQSDGYALNSNSEGQRSTMRKLLQLVDQLNETGKTYYKRTELETLVIRILGQDASGAMSSLGLAELKQALKDSILSASIAGVDDEDEVGQLLAAFRAILIVEAIAARDSSLTKRNGVTNLLEQPLILPEDVFPLPEPARTAYAADNSATEALEKRLTEIDSSITSVTAALNELMTVDPTLFASVPPATPAADTIAPEPDAETSTEVDAVTAVEPMPGMPELAITDAVVTNLSTEAMATIGTIAPALSPAGMNLDLALESLDQRLSTLQADRHQVAQELSAMVVHTSPLFTATVAMDKSPFDKVIDKGTYRILGVGELMVVNKTLNRYEPGEVAHVENVMPREKKSRKITSKTSSEEQYEFFEETSREKSQNMDTTRELELKLDSQRKSGFSTDFGVDVTASFKFGKMFELKTGVKYASKTSREQSMKSAERNAQKVVSKLVDSMESKIHEKRKTTLKRETETVIEHVLNNEDKDEAAKGIYCWLDKYYDASIRKFDERMMVEFVVPQPSALLMHNELHHPNHADKPVAPTPPLFFRQGIKEGTALRPEHLTPENYTAWATQYQIPDLPAAPPLIHYEYCSVATRKPASKQPDKNTDSDTPQIEDLTGSQLLYNWVHQGDEAKTMTVPEGYRAVSASAQIARSNFELDEFVSISIGGHEPPMMFGKIKGNVPDQLKPFMRIGGDYMYRNNIHFSGTASFGTSKDKINGLTGEVPVVAAFKHKGYIGATVRLRCVRDIRQLGNWQRNVYRAIMNGYKTQLQRHEEKVLTQSVETGIAIEGRNPVINREIIKDELHRNALTLLHQRKWTSNQMGHLQNGGKNLDLDLDKVKWLAKAVQFFELAFDWHHMGFEFFPYCWASRDKWPALQDANDPDYEFLQFLRAGAARMIVPVQPGYEEDVLRYAETGTFGKAPGLSSPKFRHLAAEFRKRTDPNANSTQVGTAWQVKVPTAHVMITKELPPVKKQD